MLRSHFWQLKYHQKLPVCVRGAINQVIKTKTKAMLVYVLNVIVHGPTKAQELHAS